jgi:hypothetical protein
MSLKSSTLNRSQEQTNKKKQKTNQMMMMNAMIILTDSFIGCTKSNKAKGKEYSVHGNMNYFIMTSVEFFFWFIVHCESRFHLCLHQ